MGKEPMDGRENGNEAMKGLRIAGLENECEMAMNKGKKQHGNALYTSRIDTWKIHIDSISMAFCCEVEFCCFA